MTGTNEVAAPEVASPNYPFVKHLQALPVGWAAILLVLGATVWAVVASLTGFDYATAAFAVVAIMVGALFSIAAWDLFVTFVGTRKGQALRLPYTITLDLPRWIVPYLTPVAFVGGILIGHRFWH
jgi:hypothetical protein